MDPRLTGLLVGQTLHTSRAEIYRALIEATAFGARAIIERLREYGVPIERVVCCGGIAEKNDLFMQIYADVIGQPMLDRRLAADAGPRRRRRRRRSRPAARPAATTLDEAQERMTSLEGQALHAPIRRAHAVYDELYAPLPRAARRVRRRGRRARGPRAADETAARHPRARGARGASA